MSETQKKKKKKRKDDFVVDDEFELDDEDEYNPSIITLNPSKNKKKRKRQKKKESKKKRRKKNPPGEDPIKSSTAIPPETLNLDDSEITNEEKFDALLQRAKDRSAPRRYGAEENIVSDESLIFIRKMSKAHTDDKLLMDRSEIPFHKLNLLNSLKLKGSQYFFQLALIEDGVLFNFTEWLKPYKGKLPNLEIRKTLIDLLMLFPCEVDKVESFVPQSDNLTFGGITVEKLNDSKIRQVIRFLSTHKKEIPSNKRKCKKLLEKWDRLIRKSSIDDIDEQKPNYRRLKTVENFASDPDLEPGDIGFISRATIPRVVGYDFHKKPTSKMISRNPNYVSESKERLQKKMFALKRKSKSRFK